MSDSSIVDVVQSVGRVMRKAPDKDYGYVILPVAVPEGVEPSVALADNQRFKVVWQVLNALRSHDERFDAMVNSIALNAPSTKKKTGVGSDMLLGGHVGAVVDEQGVALPAQIALFSLSRWQEAIYARIVDKVGTRTYWEQWAADVADIAATLTTRIKALLTDATPEVAKGFERFLAGLRDNLNDSITGEDAISMLSQHLITKPVFDALFAEHEFTSHNPVSSTMQRMVDTIGGAGLEAETARLEGFYSSVRRRAGEVTSAEGKQQVIAELYEKFFRIGFKKQAEALGIVYTPVQIVDFILRAADLAMRKHFGRGLTDEGVHILDGFAGTGTFVTRLLQSDLIIAGDLKRKHSAELHANEIMLLAYYIAAVNIESTYHALAGKTAGADAYAPFSGMVLADTFQVSEAGDSMDAIMFPYNNARILRQLHTPIGVILGNRPYSVGQTSANDLNANVKYPTLDGRIEQTYAKRSTATNENSLYDSYIRAFRWATDRIGDVGVVAFVSNGGWIDGNAHDGMRLSLADDYATVYVYNLRGNARTAGELRQKEAGNAFGGGSRNTVAIFIGVKDPTHTGPCDVHYRDIGDYLSREAKLRIVEDSYLDTVDWQAITPNARGDWVSQRDEVFTRWPAIGEKKTGGDSTVFVSYSAGLKTGRDAWCYSYSVKSLTSNVRELLEQYREVARALHTSGAVARLAEDHVTRFLAAQPELTSPGRISWSAGLKQQLAMNSAIDLDAANVRASTYRPFTRQWSYLDRRIDDRVYQLPSMFPTPGHENVGFYVVGTGSDKPFSCLMTESIPDLAFWGSSNGQFFPRWTYEQAEDELDFTSPADVDEHGYRRVDNIADGIRKLYRESIGDQVTKDDIFYYVYGLLHDPTYREKYAADLKKMLPHIPTPQTRERFERLAAAGRRLAELHVGYESVEPYPLDVRLKPGTDANDRETWRVAKMEWRSKQDHSAIVYNTKVTIEGIPEEAERYLLGSRSALGWIIDRYQVNTDKASGIVNDPNDWCDEHENPAYIVDLIKKVTTVSVETVKIVDSLAAVSKGE